MPRVYLGLGSNVGDRMGSLRLAVQLLSRRMTVVRVSSVYETEPAGFEDQPLFLNAVVCTSAELGPFELLSLAKRFEGELGREHSFRNAPRPIDIDILLYGDMVIGTRALTVPHPRMAERAFVLVPLAELAGRLVDPVTRKRVDDLAAEVDGVGGVRRMEELSLEPATGWQRRADVSDIS